MYNQKELVTLSKLISKILRHKPQEFGLCLDEHGWLDVDELIRVMKNTNPDFDKDTLDVIVETNNKKRYSYNENHTKIRANQGHSVKVDVELDVKEPPEFLYHGTTLLAKESIMKKGLDKQSRLHVHLSKDLETAKAVGNRHPGKTIIFEVQAHRMYLEGYTFYLSKNGVWLVEAIPIQYLRLMEELL